MGKDGQSQMSKQKQMTFIVQTELWMSNMGVQLTEMFAAVHFLTY